MRKSSLAAAARVGFVLLLAQGVVAEAAEVKIIGVPAISAVIGELGPQFERATGHKLVTR